MVFVLCVVLGAVAVPWRASHRAAAARALARTEALARSAVIELQLSRTRAVPDAVARAGLDDLAKKGYDYVLFVPASAQQKAMALAGSGGRVGQDAVQQPVRAQNAEWRLALKPRGGWVNWTKVTLEAIGVIVFSGLLALAASLLESRREGEAALAEATQRVERETKDRQQAQEQLRAATAKVNAVQLELQQAQEALRQGEARVQELEGRLEATLRSVGQAGEASQARLREAEAAARQVQARLEARVTAAEAAAQAHKAELEQALAQAQERQATIEKLQARLDTALRSARKAAEQAEDRVAELTARLDKLQAGAGEQSGEEPGKDAVPAAPAEESAPASELPPEQVAPEPTPAPPEPASPAADASAASATETVAVVEPPPADKPVRPPKRKRTRRDDQIELFSTAEPDAEERPAVVMEPWPPPVAAAVEEQPPAAETDKASVEETAGSKPAPEAAQSEAAEVADDSESAESGPKAAPRRREEKPPPPVDPAELRKAVNLIVPLLADADPGAKDCLRDNRTTFRSAFSVEGYGEFEQFVKHADFAAALEHLKKAAKRHGIPV